MTARAGRSRTTSLLVQLVIGACLGAVISSRIVHPSEHRAFVSGVLLTPMAICFELWLVLSIYWGVAARGASAAKSSESRASRYVHLAMISGAQVLVFWPYAGWPAAGALTFEFPRILPAWPQLAWIGVAVQVGALLLALWSRRQLGRNWSGEVTLKVDHELVRSGPYRRIRHPIYTGAIGMYLGPALVSGRWQGVLGLALVALAYARKIRQEERVLRAEFGAAYDDYERESWVLIPGVL